MTFYRVELGSVFGAALPETDVSPRIQYKVEGEIIPPYLRGAQALLDAAVGQRHPNLQAQVVVGPKEEADPVAPPADSGQGTVEPEEPSTRFRLSLIREGGHGEDPLEALYAVAKNIGMLANDRHPIESEAA